MTAFRQQNVMPDKKSRRPIAIDFKYRVLYELLYDLYGNTRLVTKSDELLLVFHDHQSPNELSSSLQPLGFNQQLPAKGRVSVLEVCPLLVDCCAECLTDNLLVAIQNP